MQAIKIIFAIVVSIAISDTIRALFAIANGIEIDLRTLVYVFVISLFQMFFPFLIYFLGANRLTLIINKKSLTKRNIFLRRYLAYIGIMVAVVLLMSLGDVLLFGSRKNFFRIMREFELFALFAFVSFPYYHFVVNRSRKMPDKS